MSKVMLVVLVAVWYAASVLFNLGMKRSHALVADVFVLTTMHFSAGAACLMVAKAMGCLRIPGGRWLRPIITSAAFFWGGTFTTNLSLITLSVSFTHVIKTCEPIFTIVIVWLIDRSLPSGTAVLSLLATLAGVLIATMHQRQKNGAGSVTLGLWAGMLANALLQLRNVLNKRIMRGEPPMARPSDAPAAQSTPPRPLDLVFLTLGAALPMQLLLHGCMDIYLALQPAPPTVSRYAHYGDAHPLWLLVTPISFVVYQAASVFVLAQVDPVTHAVLNSLKRMVLIGIGAVCMRERLAPGYAAGATLAVVGVT